MMILMLSMMTIRAQKNVVMPAAVKAVSSAALVKWIHDQVYVAMPSTKGNFIIELQ